jgi:hypothetical protein
MAKLGLFGCCPLYLSHHPSLYPLLLCQWGTYAGNLQIAVVPCKQ